MSNIVGRTMADSRLCRDILELRNKINKYSQKSDDDKILKYLEKLGAYPLNVATLKETEIGITVNKLRKNSKNLKIISLSKSLIKKWKKLVPDTKQPSKSCTDKSPTDSVADSSTLNLEISCDTDDPVRLKSIKLLAESLVSKGFTTDFGQLATQIERCVYNEFQCLDSRYKGRIRSRIVNLRDKTNPKLKENVLNGVIAPERFARMTCDEMASDEVKKMKEEMLKRSILEAQVPKTNLSSSNLFKCSRCGERDTTYNQVQTLSGDEPMTTFVVCNKCGKRWKFN